MRAASPVHVVRYRARGVVMNISLFLSGLLVRWGADEPTPPTRRGAPMNEADRLMLDELRLRGGI